MEQLLDLVHDGIDGRASLDWQEVLERQSTDLAVAAHGVRARLLESDSQDGTLAEALSLTDVLRSLERAARHVQRICRHLMAGRQALVPERRRPG